MPHPRGATLLLLILLTWFSFHYSRTVFHSEDPPAFFVEDRQGVTVMLGEGFPFPGVHQFPDGISLSGVIELTGLSFGPGWTGNGVLGSLLQTGECLEIVCKDGQVADVERSWMPAPQRMALGLALHPDRMSLEDWEALPGIGAALAQRIEIERQENGGFGTLEGLQRVRGIGPRRIQAWKGYFH